MKSIYQNPSILLAAAAVLFTLAPQAGAEEAKKGTLEVGGLT